MTLATRCPACGTVFRVVQDQLRVSEGWVRCGRCSEAFNALETMVEWPAARPASDPPPTVVAPPPPPPVPVPESTPTSRSDVAAESVPGAALEPTFEPVPAGHLQPTVDHELTPALVTAEATLIDLPPGVVVVETDGALSPDLALPAAEAPGTSDRVEPDFGFEAAVPAPPDITPAPAVEAATVAAAAPAAVATSSSVADEAAAAVQPAPSFVLQAERAARWRRPGVRLALGLASLLAALGLAAQVTYAFRDRIAATAPAARPLLQQACAAIGCRIGEYRQIDALSMESSALVRVEGAPVYRLAVTLRNRAAVEVAAPALDLALTDAQGRPIARRVLQMSDLNLPLRSLKPGSELPIQVPLGIGGQVSGYTVEIFYP